MWDIWSNLKNSNNPKHYLFFWLILCFLVPKQLRDCIMLKIKISIAIFGTILRLDLLSMALHRLTRWTHSFKKSWNFEPNWQNESIASICSTLKRHLKFAGDPFTQPIQTGSSAWIYESNGRFVCSLCQKSFGSRGGCRNHSYIHFGETTCGICKKVMSHKGALATHMAKHMGIIRCERCDQTFASKAVLQRHHLTSKCGNKFRKKQPC